MVNTTKDLFVFANLDGEFVPARQLQVDEEGSRCAQYITTFL